MALSAGEWADSLTNISIGELLAEPMPNVDINCRDFPGALGSNCHQQTAFSCDSFDAAIAAHMYKHQNKVEQHDLAFHAPSIWDAEETCDAFSFQKNAAFCGEDRVGSLEACKQPTTTSPSVSPCEVEV